MERIAVVYSKHKSIAMLEGMRLVEDGRLFGWQGGGMMERRRDDGKKWERKEES